MDKEKKSNYFFSIVVPVFNEESGFTEAANALIELRKKYSLECELIFVNDGSTDNTYNIMQNFASIPGVILMNNSVNLGYGYSLKRGISLASSDIICIIDADGSYPVEQIPEMLKYVDKFDMVVGARQGVHYWGSFLKNPSRKIFLTMIRYITGVKVPDGNSGLRIFKRSRIIDFFNLIGNKFSFTTSLTLASHYSGHAIKYIPIQYNKRSGKTKIRHIRDSIGVIQLMLQVSMYFDPFKVVFPIFFLFNVISGALFYCYIATRDGLWAILGFMNIFFAILTLFFGLWCWLFIALTKKTHNYVK